MKKMADIENVIEALHCRAYDDDFPCSICAYYRKDERPVAKCDYQGLMDDAIELLKEKLPVVAEVEGGTTWWYVCGNCHTAIDRKDKYCRECGRLVKWYNA